MTRVGEAHPKGVLKGRRAWIISDGKAGHEIQCRGVAEALGVDVEVKRIEANTISKLTAPWGPVRRSVRFGQEGSRFAPPWPDVAFSAGRLTIPYIRVLKRKAGPATFTVVMLNPRTLANCADLIWVPAHDARRGPNVISTLTSPHGFSEARLGALRAQVPEAIAALPRPRVAVFIGGPNGVYAFTEADAARFGAALKSVARTGAGLMISPSRRTPSAFLAEIDSATTGVPRLLFDGTGDNPYADFLAHADAFIVTADSVNMAGEAAATGKPIYIFEPEGGSLKFSRFHEGLRDYGATRVLPAEFAALDEWHYPPLHSAEVIAAEIERRWQIRKEMLPGLMNGGED